MFGLEQNMQILKSRNNIGFTLVEVVLVIFIFSVLVGFSMPVYNRFQNSNNIELVVIEAVQILRRAQILSQASDGDSNWGVYIASGQMTLFKGSTYLSRDTNYDEVYTLAGPINISGLQEIVFNKFTGEPQSTGTITFSINTNVNKTITINSKGMLSY